MDVTLRRGPVWSPPKGFAHPPADVVPRDVVRDECQDRDQRPGLATGPEPGELSDRVDAQVTP